MRKLVLLAVAFALATLFACASPPSSALPSLPMAVTWPPGSAAVSAPSSSGPEPFDASQLDLRVTQATIGSTIAVKGYTASVRPPESVTQPIKLSLMRLHDCPGPPSAYELDHFIPLELGGSSDRSNLWLEPIAEARRKDKDENLARSRVVSGAWKLAEGQQFIRDRWRIHYADTGAPASPGQSKVSTVTGITVSGSVPNASPPQKTPVTVSATVTDGLGRPVKGIRVGFIWHFKTVTRTDWVVTDASGVACDTRQIGRATKGYRVNVDLVVDSPGSSSGATSFVPW